MISRLLTDEDHTGYLYLAAFDNTSDEAVSVPPSLFKAIA